MVARILTALTVLNLAACVPAGGGDGYYSTAWRGVISVGPASVDGSPACGVPPADVLDCEPGHTAIKSPWYVACLPDGAGMPRILDVRTAGGDWVALDVYGQAASIGRTQGGVAVRVWCVRDSQPVAHGWWAQVFDVSTRQDIDQRCWDPDTGASADCDDLGR